MFHAIAVFLMLVYGASVVWSYPQYTAWSPDGHKRLWCPNSCSSYVDKIKYDHCCACYNKPTWSFTGSEQFMLEIKEVTGQKSVLMTKNPNASYFSFVYLFQNLRKLPSNICQFPVVHVDVTGNKFREIGNISCLSELDTLIMKDNGLTYVSNHTFRGLTNLRHIDLSFNFITKMDINLFEGIHLLHLNFEQNSLTHLDVSIIFFPNKTICGSSYANNSRPIEITNEQNIIMDGSNSTVCGNIRFDHVELSHHPFFLMFADLRKVPVYAPCGDLYYYGIKFDCDCRVSEFLHYGLDLLNRFQITEKHNAYCRSPVNLIDVSLWEIVANNTIRDLMTCDIQDFCPSFGDCKCVCSSNSYRRAIIVDCSNQNCQDFPEVMPHDITHANFSSIIKKVPLPRASLPEMLLNFDIILNMSYNNMKTMDTKQGYFKKVRILDMTGNPIQIMTENIKNLSKATGVILSNHNLQTLPRNIKELNPNIFHFGRNGIPCDCNNMWIGEWRSFKKAFKFYPYALRCSNREQLLFEDILLEASECRREEFQIFWVVVVVLFVWAFLLLGFLSQKYRYDIILLRRQTRNKVARSSLWIFDVYISFDENDKEMRNFVMSTLEQWFRNRQMTTFIPYRDTLAGYTEEENIKSNMLKCKYCLIMQSPCIYDDNFVKRMEFKTAWEYYRQYKVDKILVLNDSEYIESFQFSLTRALYRFGLGFVIPERKHSLENKIRSVFDQPLFRSRFRAEHCIRRNVWVKARQTS